MATGEILPVALDAKSLLLAPSNTTPQVILNVAVPTNYTLHGTVTIGALMVSGVVMHTWSYLCQCASSGSPAQVLISELHQNGGQPAPSVSFAFSSPNFQIRAQMPVSPAIADNVRWTCALRGHLIEQPVT